MMKFVSLGFASSLVALFWTIQLLASARAAQLDGQKNTGRCLEDITKKLFQTEHQ